ncbi:MAG: TIR domain-containing protein, partial [Clostridia bacterium]|nr:TIR domain-containing protein [Clostridia bacterium]
PTCNRASIVSVFDDENYKHAISFAGEFQKQDLEESGKQIEEILKKVVKLSKNEPPYDIFICYKKTSLVSNANGEESYTKDSVHAREIYEILTEQGYKVFFAEKTLQNIGGNEYEPIIFNALNTSHVMLVVSSKIEYINAPWVKNEWRRFVKQMEFDESKKLIPIMCGDMTPAKLPDLLKKYQALELDVNFQKNLLTSVKNCLGALRNNLKKVSIDGVKVAKKSNIVKSAVESRKISSSNQNVFKATEQIQLKNALRHFDKKTLSLSDAWTEFNDLKSIPKLTAISEYALELVKYKKIYYKEKFNKKILKEIQASPFDEAVFVEKFNTCVENVDKDTLDFVFRDIRDEFYRDYVSYNHKGLLFEMIMSWDYEGKETLSQRAYEYILKYSNWRIERLAEAFAKFYDQKDVDGYIEKLEKIADSFANNSEFKLAQNFYSKVLEVDEGNTKVRWKKYYSGLMIKDEGSLEYVIHRLTEKDTNDFKEFLAFVPAGQRNSYIHKMLKACTESLDVLGIRQKLENAQYLQYENNKHNWKLKVDVIKKCVAGEAVSRKYLKKMIVQVNKEHGVNWDEKHATKIFDAIVCLYSEKSTDSL